MLVVMMFVWIFGLILVRFFVKNEYYKLFMIYIVVICFKESFNEDIFEDLVLKKYLLELRLCELLVSLIF